MQALPSPSLGGAARAGARGHLGDAAPAHPARIRRGSVSKRHYGSRVALQSPRAFLCLAHLCRAVCLEQRDSATDRLEPFGKVTVLVCRVLFCVLQEIISVQMEARNHFPGVRTGSSAGAQTSPGGERAAPLASSQPPSPNGGH